MDSMSARVASYVAEGDPLRPRFVAVVEVEDEIPDVRTLVLDMGDDWSFDAGQFNMLYLPGYGEAAISISSSPGAPRRIAHTIRRAGNVTSALLQLKPGDLVGIRGPFGSSWPWQQHRGSDLVIAAGGIGLAPLRPLIEELIEHRADFGNISLLYGARTPSGLLYSKQYDRWRNAGFEIELTVDHADEDWKGHIGVVPSLLDTLDLSVDRTVLFACGPEIMMRFVARAARKRTIADDRIYVSMERNMNCAVGFCGHCQLGGEFVCKDGPVFTYERIGRYFYVEDF